MYQDVTKLEETHLDAGRRCRTQTATRLHRYYCTTASASDLAIYGTVMNTNSGSWCRYTGMNALSWTLLESSSPISGTYDGRVVMADEGTDDGGVLLIAGLLPPSVEQLLTIGMIVAKWTSLFHFVSFLAYRPTAGRQCQLTLKCKLPKRSAYPGWELLRKPRRRRCMGSRELGSKTIGLETAMTQNFTIPVGKLGIRGVCVAFY